MRPELLAADLMLEDHILDVGSLRGVRVSGHVDRGELRLPRLYIQGGDDMTETFRLAGLIVRKRKRQRRLLMASADRWLPPTQAPDQVTAAEHAEACRRLDRTPAGRKAQKLLFAHLSEDQRDSAARFGYFDEWILDTARVEHELSLGRPPVFVFLLVRFDRFYPNGNIDLLSPTMRASLNLCIHPTTPYPTDDIVLSQLLALRSDPDAFIREANVTEEGHPVRYGAMWEPSKAPRLVDVCHS